MLPCPSDAELLRLALMPEGSAPSSDPVARHVAECPRCQRELAELRESAAGLKEAEGPGPEDSGACLDDEAIAAVVEGRSDGRALAHLAECGACRERVAEISRLLRHDPVAAEVRGIAAAVDETGRGRWLRLGLGVAAAVAVMAVYGIGRTPRPDRLREEPVTLISAPVPVQPAGAVGRVDSLSWHAVARATQYRVTLFGQDGSTVWETGTTDTVVTLPAGIRLAPGGVYYWKVQARTDWNRWTASEMVEIRVGGSR
jgi:hypothetical protein